MITIDRDKIEQALVETRGVTKRQELLRLLYVLEQRKQFSADEKSGLDTKSNRWDSA